MNDEQNANIPTPKDIENYYKQFTKDELQNPQPLKDEPAILYRARQLDLKLSKQNTSNLVWNSARFGTYKKPDGYLKPWQLKRLVKQQKRQNNE